MVKKDLVNKYDLKDFQNFTLKKKINYFKFLERLMRNSKDTIFYQDNSLDKTEIKFLLLNSNSSKCKSKSNHYVIFLKKHKFKNHIIEIII